MESSVSNYHSVNSRSRRRQPGRRHLRPPAPRPTPYRAAGPLDATDTPRPEDPHAGDEMSIPTPACTPAARPDPVPRADSPAAAGLWIAPAAWKTRMRRSRLNAPPSRRVSHTALDGTKRRPHAPQARSLYSLNTTSRVGLLHPLRNRWEETRRETSLRSDERSRSPESVFTFPGSGVQLHRNARDEESW